MSEILTGREVTAYDVLARITDGLGVPRGHLSLAYDEVAAVRIAGISEASGTEEIRLVAAEPRSSGVKTVLAFTAGTITVAQFRVDIVVIAISTLTVLLLAGVILPGVWSRSFVRRQSAKDMIILLRSLFFGGSKRE